jgi:N-acetylmuramate 1-kinase
MNRGEIVRFARETLGLAADAATELVAFEGRGSDRTYFRFLWGTDSAILVHYEPGRIENTYYAAIALYLSANGIPVPQLLRHDPVNCLILMKDLGDTDLWSFRNESWDRRKPLYEKTLKIVHALHTLSVAEFPAGQVKLTEAFGPSLYRWEREYFKENFIEALCSTKLEGGLSSRLETELSGLAERLSSARRSLVHRDLQSQNVMICGEQPYLIDFQGMRFGIRFYDLGSILCDPYVELATSERMELLSYYYRLSEPDLDWSGFQNAFWEASAQRLMQALGAYGFLGIRKGLSNYLAHVPAALQNLCTAAENAVSLPTLVEVCTKIDRRFDTAVGC